MGEVARSRQPSPPRSRRISLPSICDETRVGCRAGAALGRAAGIFAAARFCRRAARRAVVSRIAAGRPDLRDARRRRRDDAWAHPGRGTRRSRTTCWSSTACSCAISTISTSARSRLPSRTVPVTIKSLVFSEDPRAARPHQRIHHHGHQNGHDHEHQHGHGITATHMTAMYTPVTDTTPTRTIERCNRWPTTARSTTF